MTDRQASAKGGWVEQHFVVFYSPGTLVAEESRRAISEWDVDLAVAMSQEIVERHGARPYGFQFQTRSRSDDEHLTVIDWDEAVERGLRFSGRPSLLIGIRDKELEEQGLTWENRPVIGLDEA